MSALFESAISGLLGAVIGAVSSYQLLQYRVQKLEEKSEEMNNALKTTERRIEERLQKISDDTATIRLDITRMTAFAEGTRAKNP